MHRDERAVESREPSAMHGGERDEVGVGHLLVALDARKRSIEEGNDSGKKSYLGCSRRYAKALCVAFNPWPRYATR